MLRSTSHDFQTGSFAISRAGGGELVLTLPGAFDVGITDAIRPYGKSASMPKPVGVNAARDLAHRLK